MVGELSKYKKIVITPTSTASIEFDNPFEIDPKIILITVDPEYTGNTKYLNGVLRWGVTGGMNYRASDSSLTGTIMYYANESTSNARFGYYNGQIRINRYSSSVGWSTATNYTIEIYA